ncbi:MAG: carbonate dehydratase [Robiginitomaculum sp.]|nr:MAG: carbonate dehydratase [Robiginitomaculum sp.]
MTNFPLSLLTGYAAFRKNHFFQENKRYKVLAEKGQTPEILVIACCDSRAGPETIFNTRPGEIFVIRNVANMIPPRKPDGQHHSTSAALEFAVTTLKVKHILVMGHGRCGGIAAALASPSGSREPGDFIGNWMDLLTPSTQKVLAAPDLAPAEQQLALERASIIRSIDNLRTFPAVRQREAQGKLQLHGGWFDISSGELWVYDADLGQFVQP